MTETKKMQLVDWLDDLCVRFLVNLPQEELQEPERICFQIEEAQWFYEDFIRPLDPTLPQLNLSEFASRILRHCPLTAGYSDDLHEQAFKRFLTYKTRVPVRGAILLDEDMEKILLVKGYKKNATWSFPRGKINKNEDDLVCAIREVWEETGYDIESAELVPNDRNVHHIDVTMREQHLRMFVFRNVPLDTHFEPQTRKEISKIQWYRLDSLPTYNSKKRSHQVNEGSDVTALSANKLYMVAPFLPALKRWINQQRKRDAHRFAQLGAMPRDYQDVPSDAPVESEHTLQPMQLDPADPADELKRFLSLASGTQQSSTLPLPNATIPQDAPPAGMLLAMLRGTPNGLAAPTANQLPVTPMEQLMGPPLEPNSPHVHHVKSSPQVTRQPPPEYPFATDRQHAQEVTRSMERLGMNGAPPGSFDNMMSSANHPQAHLLQMFQQQQHQQQHHHQQQQQQQHQQPMLSHIPAHEQMMTSLQPQGRGAIAHGPAAPKASQLPPPNMNSHAMNLLNAFKTPSQAPQQPMYMTGQMQSPPTADTARHFQQHAYPQEPAHAQQEQPSFMQPQQNFNHGAVPPAGPPRSQHQNSLLDLFRSPTSQNGTPATQESGQNHYRAASLQAAQPAPSPQPIVAAPSKETPKQRSATMAMMTRTLPKGKSPLASKAAVTNKPSEPSAQPFSAKRQSLQGRPVSKPQSPTATSEMGKPPITVLARPQSNTGSPAAATRMSPASADSVPSPRKGRHNKATDQSGGPSFTILQRPASGKPAESPTSSQQSIPSQSNQTEAATKPFQPQLLRRPKTEETGTASSSALPNPASPSQGGSDQRDTLLALFAKSGPGRNKAADTVTPGTEAAPSASPFPLPTDPSEFRSRIASNASVVSNSDGMKSPSTPVEAKGFLLDYLNGVVKGEHYRGSKLPQI